MLFKKVKDTVSTCRLQKEGQFICILRLLCLNQDGNLAPPHLLILKKVETLLSKMRIILEADVSSHFSGRHRFII